MRASTASVILAFCAMLAVQSAPLQLTGDAGLAVREVEMSSAMMARDLPLEAREVEIEERDPKKYDLYQSYRHALKKLQEKEGWQKGSCSRP